MNFATAQTPQLRFKFLDSLRGIAALLVVLFHQHALIKIASSYSFPSFLESILSQGYLGVQIFFVLSGFVIAYSIRQASFSLEFIKYFYIKRSIRLDPPYWAALIVMIAATTLFSTFIAKEKDFPFEGALLFANFFYLQDFFNYDSINPVAWTLCIELQLYMFFVILLAVLMRLGNIFNQVSFSIYFPLLFSLLLLISLEYNFPFLTYSTLSTFRIKGFFIPYWYSFFMGSAVCWALIEWIPRTWLLAFFGIVGFYALNSMESEVWGTLMIAGIIYGMGQIGYLTGCIISPLFQYLGKISFSLYLIHWFTASNCIHFLCKRAGAIDGLKITGIFLFSLFLSILAAHVFYLCIESPCLRLCKRYGKKDSQSFAAKI